MADMRNNLTLYLKMEEKIKDDIAWGKGNLFEHNICFVM